MIILWALFLLKAPAYITRSQIQETRQRGPIHNFLPTLRPRQGSDQLCTTVSGRMSKPDGRSEWILFQEKNSRSGSNFFAKDLFTGSRILSLTRKMSASVPIIIKLESVLEVRSFLLLYDHKFNYWLKASSFSMIGPPPWAKSYTMLNCSFSVTNWESSIASICVCPHILPKKKNN